ncbi:hypothetical protein ABZ746_23310 [Streptomyces sp. NPDC020096]
MKPETLWQSYAWSPGICWRCSAVAFVAICGSSHSASAGTAATIEVCGPCLIYVDQIHTARAHWQRRGINPTTPEELAAYYVPAAVSPEYAERLRQWVASLMAQLDTKTMAELTYGVRGRVTLPEAS